MREVWRINNELIFVQAAAAIEEKREGTVLIICQLSATDPAVTLISSCARSRYARNTL